MGCGKFTEPEHEDHYCRSCVNYYDVTCIDQCSACCLFTSIHTNYEQPKENSMSRDVIHLDASYNGINLVFEDDSLAEVVRNALKKARKVSTEYVGNKRYQVAVDAPKFSIDYYEVITEEQFINLQARAEQEELAEAILAETDATEISELKLAA